jgi:hypothetical protein
MNECIPHGLSFRIFVERMKGVVSGHSNSRLAEEKGEGLLAGR